MFRDLLGAGTVVELGSRPAVVLVSGPERDR